MRGWTAIVASALLLSSCTSYVHQRPSATAQRATQGTASVGVIGLSLGRATRDVSNPVLIVDGTVPEGPAARAGIHPGDRIVAIDGAPTRGMSLGEAARLIRGPAHSSVTLALRTSAGTRSVTLMRVSPESLGSLRATPPAAPRRSRTSPKVEPSGSVPGKKAPAPPVDRP